MTTLLSPKPTNIERGDAMSVKERVISYLKANDAFWQWAGHKHVAQLTSGKLSDFFANCTPIFSDVFLQDAVGDELVAKHSADLGGFALPGNFWFIGSAMGAIGLAQSAARACGDNEQRQGKVNVGYTEPDGGGGMKLRFNLGEKPRVALVEDVITTGGTQEKTVRAIKAAHPDAEIFDTILVVVNRSGKDKLTMPHPVKGMYEFNVSALIEVDAKVWATANDLPGNMQACVPIRPKATAENWQALTTEML
jgi:orotate phosphoribosyltransferase